MYKSGDRIIYKGVPGTVEHVFESGKTVVMLDDGRRVWI